MSQRAALTVPTPVHMKAAERSEPLFGGSDPKPWFKFENKKSKTAKVYIYDEIGASFWGGGVSPQDFINELNDISAKEFELHINSPGGDIFDGIAIYNAVISHEAKVTVFIDALAASAASFIAQAGDNIVMTRGSMMMIHDGIGLRWGNAQAMREQG